MRNASHTSIPHCRIIRPFLLGIATLFCLVAVPGILAQNSSVPLEEPFSFDMVVHKAQALSLQPYSPPESLPGPLQGLSYDTWRDLVFNPEKAFWLGENLPFQLQFFHPGNLYNQGIILNEVQGENYSFVQAGKSFYNYSRHPRLQEQLPENIGLAGFRVHYRINKPDFLDEFLVFLGASYFRGVGRDQRYGLSARGLAVNTALSKGEEFPWFREFWIEKPDSKAKNLRIYALLDSESLSGAYAFTVTPGEQTVLDVSARLFQRKPVEKIGLAPLTSMFFYGENSIPSQRQDWRPEVHDSDGLLIHFDSGEWLWRPTVNPRNLQVSLFDAPNVRGFGLLQRDTDFRNYQDLEARYDLRSSLWIEPKGDWGPGVVEFVEIPSEQEIHDNLTAYWVPANLPGPGDALAFDYRMSWHKAPAVSPPGARVTATWNSRIDERTQRFILEFEGENLANLPEDSGIRGIITVGPGAEILEDQCYQNPVTQGWRLAFMVRFAEESTLEQVLPDKRSPVEFRAFLRHGEDVLSETWNYAFQPLR